MVNPVNWNEHDDWRDDYVVYYEPPETRTVFEDFGPARVSTGVLDPSGHPIYNRNPNIKQPIGFHKPTPVTPGVKRF